MMMRPGDILGRIFFILSQKSIIGSSEFIHGAHGGHGSSEFKRNLNGIYTDFIELLRKKSLGEIFFKMLLRKKYFREIES